MPRDTSNADFQALLDDPKVECFSTLDVVYSTGAERHWATRAYSLDGTDYTAYLKRVGDIVQSLDSPVDRVSVELRNQDKAIGLEAASDLRYFAGATASVGRIYLAEGNPYVHQATLFPGAIANVAVDQTSVKMDVVDSLIARGNIIAARNYAARCGFTYKDARTCGSTDSSRSSCNHILNSAGGCAGDATANQITRFGGWYFPYVPVVHSPGTMLGGLRGGGIIIGGGDFEYDDNCFTAETPVRMADDSRLEIALVRSGMRVKSFYFDEQSQTDVIVDGEVAETFEHLVFEYYEFTFDDGRVLRLTPEHPLYRGLGAFFIADYARLAQDYLVYDRQAQVFRKSKLVKMEYKTFADPQKVYNFHVRGTHTYLANDTPVHNFKRKPYSPYAGDPLNVLYKL